MNWSPVNFLFYILIFFNVRHCMEVEESVGNEAKHEKILSRKRRYLIFPEGSSLQLVYCLTMPTFALKLTDFNLFTVGLTASLAWELPRDPYALFRRHGDVLHRRKDTDKTKLKPIYTVTDKSITTTSTRPLNYYWASDWKYSPSKYQNMAVQQGFYQTVKLHPISKYDKYYNMGSSYNYVHHRTRRDLYLKIITFLNSLMLDGKSCVLKSICEVSQLSNTQKGTFMEALMRTVFSWKLDPSANDPHTIAFNKASNKLRNCKKLFPTCNGTVFQMF